MKAKGTLCEEADVCVYIYMYVFFLLFHSEDRGHARILITIWDLVIIL